MPDPLAEPKPSNIPEYSDHEKSHFEDSPLSGTNTGIRRGPVKHTDAAAHDADSKRKTRDETMMEDEEFTEKSPTNTHKGGSSTRFPQKPPTSRPALTRLETTESLSKPDTNRPHDDSDRRRPLRYSKRVSFAGYDSSAGQMDTPPSTSTSNPASPSSLTASSSSGETAPKPPPAIIPPGKYAPASPSDPTPPPTSGKRYLCGGQDCGKGFDEVYDRDRHERQQHSDVLHGRTSDFKCPHYDRKDNHAFVRKDDLRNHEEKRHESDVDSIYRLQGRASRSAVSVDDHDVVEWARKVATPAI